MTFAEEREEICGGCEAATPERMCSACGCFIPAKVRNPGQNCPLGKWGKVEE